MINVEKELNVLNQRADMQEKRIATLDQQLMRLEEMLFALFPSLDDRPKGNANIAVGNNAFPSQAPVSGWADKR